MALEVELFGRKADPSKDTEPAAKRKAEYLEFDGGDIIAQQRFKKLRPNCIRVRGTNVGHADNKIEHITITHTGYTFAVIDKHKVSDDEIYVYFLCWPTARVDSHAEDPGTGDLTVVIDTVDEPEVTGESGSDSDTEYKAPGDENP